MSLEKYKSKRLFDQTPEPAGKVKKKSKGPLRFVVHKHQARQLHYDLRLELDGVLKSWAVPKGPSLNPDDKRLAMMVEDHPLEYGDFEGVIPAGNYGAGTVMVWDNGVYSDLNAEDFAEAQKNLKAGLKKGHLAVVLNGQKLKGAFDLVKMERGEENTWLLIKKADQYAAKKDVTKQERSALSGRTMEQITKATDRVWESNSKLEADSKSKSSEITKDSMPKDIKPMLATAITEPFDDQNWLFEVKWDGYRIITYINQGQAELSSRKQQSYTKRYQPIADELVKLKHQAVLDGEVVVLDEEGRPRFQLLQDWQISGQGQLLYCVFDLLYLDGHSTMDLPLVDRKQLLKQLVSGLKKVKFSDHVEAKGIEFFRQIQSQGLEGIMAKVADSSYMPGKRSRKWLKIKTQLRQEVIVGGFTEPRGSRKGLGALLLGIYEDKNLRYVGHTGVAAGDRILIDLRQKLDKLKRKSSPFVETPKANAPVHWVTPKLVAEVSFTEWTHDGSMRHPQFLGLREDKPAEEVKRESPTSAGSIAQSVKSQDEQFVKINNQRLKLTNLSKTYWPKDGYTKGDLVDYYRTVAKVIIPHLADRPESLNRHPNGIENEGFFQKNVEDAPNWAKTKKIQSESEERAINYLLCQDEATLVYMANLGCIEINPWLSRTSNLDKPDFCVLDLDPEAIEFKAVIKVAQAIHHLLDGLDVPSYVKTSGATGMHIYIPLDAKYTYDQSRQFAEIVARRINQSLPKITSIERSPAKRQGKVYLDFLQNRRGQTLAAPYSVRPKPKAPVSTPLKWEEVKSGLLPERFTLKNLPQRLEKVGDIWKPLFKDGVDLTKILSRLVE